MDKKNYIERFVGIDILKIISVIMILLLHFLGQGGVIEFTTGYSRFIFKAIQMFSLCAVNILCICTGFFMSDKEYLRSRIAKTIALVLVVNVSILAVSIFMGYPLISGIYYIKLSISTTYWYVVDYIVLLLLMPFLNVLILHLNKAELKRMISIIIIVTMFLPFLIGTDATGFNGGYSLAWMVFLFFVGAYEKKYSSCSKNKWMYFLGVIISYLLMMIIQYFARSMVMESLENIIDLTMSYTSPFVFAMALFWFKAFRNLRVNNKLHSTIKWFSNASLMAYIIHCNGFIYSIFLNDIFEPICNNNFLIVFLIIAIAIVCYYFIVAVLNSIWNYCYRQIVFHINKRVG